MRTSVPDGAPAFGVGAGSDAPAGRGRTPPVTVRDAFGRRLASAVRDRGPLCAGIDPHPGLLREWGLGEDVAGLERFALTAVEALADRVAVVKPQSAFFERYGSAGVAVLERVLAAARERGALILLDVKRGDIGSTVAGYAAAYLDPASPLAADAVTASPYLGFGSLAPLLAAAGRHGGGVFVLALTSNPEGASVQRARGPDGRTVAQVMLDSAAAANAAELDPAPAEMGSVGVVIGATADTTGHDLSRLRGPVLVPGVGAQGGRFTDLPGLLGPALRWALPSVSRELLRHGPAVASLRRAADRMRAEAESVLGRL